MGLLLLFIIITFLPATLLALRIFTKRKQAGKNPWFWSIFSFVITAALMYGAFFIYFMLTFER